MSRHAADRRAAPAAPATAATERAPATPPTPTAATGRAAAESTDERAGARRASPARQGRFPDLKAKVHNRCSAARPQAVRRRPDPDRARAHGPRRPAGGDAGRGQPLTRPTGPASPRRSPTTSSATARSSRSCATRTSPRSWSTAATTSGSSAAAGSQGRRPLQRRGAPAPHDRQDRVPHRPSRRRVQPDGGRPSARRQPRQRRHPAAGARRLAAHDPEVLRRPVHRRRPGRASAPTPRAPPTSSTPASAAGSTSSSPAAPAPARRPPSTCCRRSSRPTSASSPSRTPPSSSCTRTTCCGSSRARRTSRARARSTIRDLVRNSLRMRPDRIVVGEVRDAAALDMLQAMNTGHDGSICTVHANGPRDTLSRIETMVLMAGMDLPVRAIREQVASAVDLIVHQTRLKDGSRRITHVTEVERMEGDVITLQDIFLFDHSDGLRRRTAAASAASGHRPAAEVHREAGRTPTSRGPDALRHGRCPLMHDTPRLTVTWRAPSRCRGALARAVALPASRHLRSPTSGQHRPRRERDGRCRSCYSMPDGADDVDLPAPRRARSTASRRRRRTARRTPPTPTPRTSVLAIDVSDSMAGGKFDARRRPRRRFLDAAPDDVYVGLVTFAGTVETAEQPTQDRDDVRTRRSTASSSPRAPACTTGVIEAVHAAGTDGAAQRPRALGRRGHHQDATRRASPLRQERRRQGRRRRARAAAGPRDPLTQLADAGGGTVLSADDPTALTEASSPPRPRPSPSRCWSPRRSPPATTPEGDVDGLARPPAAGPYTDAAFVTIRENAAPAGRADVGPVATPRRAASTCPRRVLHGAVCGRSASASPRSLLAMLGAAASPAGRRREPSSAYTTRQAPAAKKLPTAPPPASA